MVLFAPVRVDLQTRITFATQFLLGNKLLFHYGAVCHIQLKCSANKLYQTLNTSNVTKTITQRHKYTKYKYHSTMCTFHPSFNRSVPCTRMTRRSEKIRVMVDIFNVSPGQCVDKDISVKSIFEELVFLYVKYVVQCVQFNVAINSQELIVALAHNSNNWFKPTTNPQTTQVFTQWFKNGIYAGLSLAQGTTAES